MGKGLHEDKITAAQKAGRRPSIADLPDYGAEVPAALLSWSHPR
jgi:hypothetical protein